MGEVYRARDTKLGRDVAIKILPEAFAQDADRLARFEREARTLAALNHPNIAHIHGLEEADGVRALVMELVDGLTLSEVIDAAVDPAASGREPRRAVGVGPHGKPRKDGGLALDDALPIARQIADALEAAHEQGIIHRDLKPANIKVRADGTVKVLDFGLAKAIDPSVGRGFSPGEPAGPEGPAYGDAMNSPTLTARATQMGTILGTAAYMAPEQARGRAVDKRADIWAFGCVLYEMVTGRRAFAGEDITETLASVVKDPPDLTAAPPALRRLLGRCLEKDPKKRVRDIGDVWDLVDEPAAAAPAATRVSRASRLPWIAAAVGVLSALALAVHDFAEPAVTPAATVRFQVPWPADVPVAADTRGARSFQLSPDGRHLLMTSQGVLWVRALDSPEAVRLERTQGATYPFWSPDSEWIAFFADGKLKKIARTGGPIQVICDAPDDRGGAWSPNGTIVFSDRVGSAGLSRVSESGGAPASVTTITSTGPSDGHRYPQFLPDGEHFLYLHLAGDADVAGVYVAALDGSPPVRLLPGQDNALYMASPAARVGHLVFRKQDKLMAQAFDPARRELTGPVFPIAEGVGQGENTGLGAFSVSDSGSLAYGAGTVTRVEMVWIDRSGKRQGGVSPIADINTFSLSRDQRRLALGIGEGSAGTASQIWMQALPEGLPSKLTFDPAPGWESPIWSPDSSAIVYATLNLAGLARYEIRRKALSSAGTEETLAALDTVPYLWDWSPDSAFLVYSTPYSRVSDLWMLPLDGKREPAALTKSAAEDQYGQVSPDSRWLAYASVDSGRMQIFVQPIPATGMLRLVSKDGGTMPRWRQDGKELYYRGADGQLMAVPITTGPGPTAGFEHGAPRPLFGPIPTVGNLPRFTYQPSLDGQRFLVAAPVASATPPITVVLNWQNGIRR
jgi:Tol biopolymer transport system component